MANSSWAREIFYLILFVLMTCFVHAQTMERSSESEEVIQCYDDAQEKAFLNTLRQNRSQLVEQGILPSYDEINRSPVVVLLDWPLRQSPGYSQFSYYVLSHYVDQDTVSSQILDYNCGNRTYDGHKGIDITIWPFWWKMMDDEQVEVIAAADGVIKARVDGNFDMSCSTGGYWNVISVEHADGNTAIYGHLKKYSLTSKQVGETVEAGEFLGYVGSSGSTFSPHLHFEMRDMNYVAFDPFAGSCNNAISSSLWANQKPYNDPTLMSLLTHYDEPDLGTCPYQEFHYLQNEFDPGETIYYSAYVHNLVQGQTISYSVKNPSGTTIHSWSFTAPATEKRYLDDWPYMMPNNAVSGTYSFNATFNGSTKSHYFLVGCSSNLIVANQTITSDLIYNADATITTSGNVIVASAGGLSEFQAGNKVSLKPGFITEKGSEFVAKIGGGCP